MTTSITPSDVAHVARLARLSIPVEELELYAQQLGAVLDHASDVAGLETTGVPPTAHPLPVVNVLRADEPSDCLDRSEVLSQAPAVVDDRFQVPRIGGAPA